MKQFILTPSRAQYIVPLRQIEKWRGNDGSTSCNIIAHPFIGLVKPALSFLVPPEKYIFSRRSDSGCAFVAVRGIFSPSP